MKQSQNDLYQNGQLSIKHSLQHILIWTVSCGCSTTSWCKDMSQDHIMTVQCLDEWACVRVFTDWMFSQQQGNWEFSKQSPTCVVLAGSGQCVGACPHESEELIVEGVVVRIPRYHTVLRAWERKKGVMHKIFDSDTYSEHSFMQTVYIWNNVITHFFLQPV